MTSSNSISAGRWAKIFAGLALVRFWLSDSSEESLAQRLAGAAYLIRVGSAALAYAVQVLLARWMGSFEFGIYAYVWTWVMMLGYVVDCGMASSAQRFIPEYAQKGLLPLHRGFLEGSAWIVLATSTVIAAAGALIIRLIEPHLDSYTVVPLYLAMAALPFFAIGLIQEYVARCYDWVNLALMPTYVLRQFALLVFMGLGHAVGAPMNADTAMDASIFAILITVAGQRLVLNRRLARTVGRGPRQYEVRIWLATSLPLLVVEGFFFLLSYVDVILLQQFASPDTVGVYYAATKTLALVAFIHFSVAATSAHKLAAASLGGDRAVLAELVRRSVRLTFWPSLGASVLLLAAGRPLLALFGNGFADGYYLLFLLVIGLLARASVGPAERLLNVVGAQRLCALVYAVVLASNISLCFVLIPRLGAAGAAVATSTALMIESLLLFLAVKKRLGIHMSALGGRASSPANPDPRSIEAPGRQGH